CRLAAIREFCKHGAPGKDEHRQYAKEQRTLDRPYSCHRTNLCNDRMAAERDFMLRAVSPRHQMRQYEVRDAHHDQRRDRDPRVGQFLLFEWLRLVEKLRAVAFPALLCRTSAALDIGNTDSK